MHSRLFGQSVFDENADAFTLTNADFRAGSLAVVAPHIRFWVWWAHERRASRRSNQS
jgi:hypothetical protein